MYKYDVQVLQCQLNTTMSYYSSQPAGNNLHNFIIFNTREHVVLGN
jgi:hypothetical protein